MKLSGSITTGGQTFLHRIRMWNQIIRLAFFSSLFSALSIFGVMCYKTFTYKHWDKYIDILLGYLWQTLFGPNELYKGFKVSLWLSLTSNKKMCHWMTQLLTKFLLLSLGGGFIVAMSLFFVWLWQGRATHKNQTISGSYFEKKSKVIKKISKKKQAASIKLMDIPMIQGTQTQHIFITGTTGSGKSNAFKHLIQQISSEDDTMVIVDTTGEFVEKYYTPQTDIIMNPFHADFSGWSLWDECVEPYHFDELAECLVPHTGGDMFWTQSSRTVLAEILKHLKDEPSLAEVINMVSIIKLSELFDRLQGTKAAALLDPQSEKAAASIRMNLATHLSCLAHIGKGGTDPVSIRQWINDTETKQKKLFLFATPDQRATLRPILSCWISIVIKALMTRPRTNRSCWIFIDELPSLHKLPDLSLCLSEGRKYGACMVLGVQNTAQLENIYGANITQSLVDLCSTKLVFRSASHAMAQNLAYLLGTQERIEVSEGISYGASEVRDGVSLNANKAQKPIIPPHDLLNLSDLESYVQLPGYPITKTKWSIAEF